jgi:hypothetical protein
MDASHCARFGLGSIGSGKGGLLLADKIKPRRAERVPLRADVDFRRAGDHRYRVNILDFSPEGCRMELPVNVSMGDTIWISLPGLESIQAEVCWVKEWTVGVEFSRPLYPSVFELVRERMRPVE